MFMFNYRSCLIILEVEHKKLSLNATFLIHVFISQCHYFIIVFFLMLPFKIKHKS